MFHIYKKAFGIVELLVGLAILAIIIGSILPQYREVTISSRRQVVRAQAETIASAIRSWIVLEDTPAAAAAGFSGQNQAQKTYINLATWNTKILPLLDPAFIADSNIEYFEQGNRGYLRTTQSQDVRPETGETIENNVASPWGNVTRANNSYAHFTIVWAQNSNLRHTTSPSVISFLPQ